MFASVTRVENDVVSVQVKLLKRTTSFNDRIAKNCASQLKSRLFLKSKKIQSKDGTFCYQVDQMAPKMSVISRDPIESKILHSNEHSFFQWHFFCSTKMVGSGRVYVRNFTGFTFFDVSIYRFDLSVCSFS